MKEQDVSEETRHFIFEYIDSVEQLEILLFLWSQSESVFTIPEITVAFRSSENSVSNRLRTLAHFKLITLLPEGQYRFNRENISALNTMEGLDKLYKVKKHKVFELIFSPLKKARQFADAFYVGPSSSKKEGR